MNDTEKRVITVRNSAGILKVTIDREIALKDVFFGRGDDKLPGMNRPRLEVHKGNSYGEFLITLMDRDAAAKSDFTMFIVEVDSINDPKAYIGHYQPEKELTDYMTYEPWGAENDL